jgi:hypothetical protein
MFVGWNVKFGQLLFGYGKRRVVTASSTVDSKTLEILKPVRSEQASARNCFWC